MFEKIKSVASNARNAINRKLISVQSYVMAEAPNVLTSKAGNRFLGGCLAVSASVVPVMAKPGDTTGTGGTGLVAQMQDAMDIRYYERCRHCRCGHWCSYVGIPAVPWRR